MILFLIWRCLKYSLSRALVTILARTAESFRRFFRSLRITAAELDLWVIVGTTLLKLQHFSLISNIFINIGDFAIHIFLIMNI